MEKDWQKKENEELVWRNPDAYCMGQLQRAIDLFSKGEKYYKLIHPTELTPDRDPSKIIEGLKNVIDFLERGNED